MKPLLTRSITGVLFAGLIISSLLINRYVFGAVFLIFTILGLIEFYNIVGSRELGAGSTQNSIKPQRITGIVTGIAVYLIISGSSFDIKNMFNIFILIPIMFFVFIAEIFRKQEHPFSNIAFTITGIIYVVVPLGLLNLMYNTSLITHPYPHSRGDSLKGGISEEGYPEMLLMFFCVIWIYDTFAYFTGSLIGKHKMFERISPKKTWEGLAGGLFFGLLFTFIMSYFSILHSQFSIVHWMIFGLIVIIASTFGDLTESLLKRSLNIKDSGNILPGHGGILDRFDSVLLASPIVFIYIYLLRV